MVIFMVTFKQQLPLSSYLIKQQLDFRKLHLRITAFSNRSSRWLVVMDYYH